MTSENSPPWAYSAAAATTLGLVALGLNEQFVLELLAQGYDLKTAVTTAGLVSAAAAGFAYRLLRSLPDRPGSDKPQA